MNKLILRLQNRNYYTSKKYYTETDEKNAFESFICELKEYLQKSERKYESIRICNFEFIQDKCFIKIIQIMKHLKVLKFEGHGCDIEKSEAVTEIYMKQVKLSFEILYLFENLTTLDVSDCITDYRNLENFLSMQKHLKILRLSHLREDCIFKTDKLTTNIKFSLEELTLSKVYWTNNENAMKFFKTQINLKKLTLNVDCSKQIQLELLILFFGNNLQLKTVNLYTQGYIIKDLSFLSAVIFIKIMRFLVL